ncbi:hypothetical protein LTR15_007399 [Elasticomyces elasticus]|nr:hypothetical protein LTR15_007399 [Elasticomyces elasticus]
MASTRRTKIEHVKVIASKLIEDVEPVTTLDELVCLESYDVLELLQIEGIMWYESISDKTDEKIKMRDAIATGIFRVFVAVLSAANAD